MTTNTNTLTRPGPTDWSQRRFARLAVLDGVPFGHDDPSCPLPAAAILVAEASTTAEAGLVDPAWPCARCVPTSPFSGRTVAYEARREFGEPTGARSAHEPAPADPRTEEAVAYARSYEGTFEFMLQMREKAGARRTWTPTPKMVDAILRCKAADAARGSAPQPATPGASASSEDARRARLAPNAYPGACRSCGSEVAAGDGGREKVAGTWVVWHRTEAECAATKPAEGGIGPVAGRSAGAQAVAPLPDVPEGRYAVENAEGILRFYEVDRPTGKWAGRTFVSVLASNERHPVRGEAGRAILAKIAEDPKVAMLRYGREIGRCGHCGRTLTDADSRARGVGPVCAERLGW